LKERKVAMMKRWLSLMAVFCLAVIMMAGCKKNPPSSLTSESETTTLRWTGGNNGVIIDTANQALWGTSIERLTFTKSSGKEITGILGGSTLQKYNSAIGTFKDLTFTSLEYAIRGNAEAGKERAIGIFDCYFENIYISGSKRGLWLLGSGNTIVHPRIVQCDAGLVLDFLSWESMDGIHMIGGIFIQNKVDILLPNKTCLRPCNFVGTWFEQSSEGIVKIENPYTRVQTLTFRDCMLSTNDNVPCILDFTNAGFGNVIVDGCSIIAKNPTIKAPAKHAQYGGKLIERDNYVWK